MYILMKTIKFAQPNISNLELKKVKKTLKTAWIIGGQEEFEFEKKIKKKI